MFDLYIVDSLLVDVGFAFLLILGGWVLGCLDVWIC